MKTHIQKKLFKNDTKRCTLLMLSLLLCFGISKEVKAQTTDSISVWRIDYVFPSGAYSEDKLTTIFLNENFSKTEPSKSNPLIYLFDKNHSRINLMNTSVQEVFSFSENEFLEKMKSGHSASDFQLSKLKYEYQDQTEVVEGYSCKMAIVSYPGEDGKLRIWYTKKLPKAFTLKTMMFMFSKLPGCILRFETLEEQGKVEIQLVAKNIEQVKVPKDYFKILEDYKSINRKN